MEFRSIICILSVIDSPGDYTYKEAYEYTNWHLFTEWGNWLNTTKQGPRDQTKEYKGQPVGQFFFPLAE